MENNKEKKSLKIAMILLIILLVILLCNFLVKKYSNKDKTNNKAKIENKKEENEKVENKEKNKKENNEHFHDHEEIEEEQENLAIPKVDSVESLEKLLKEDKVAILYTSKTCPPCKEQKKVYSKMMLEMNSNIKLYAVEVTNEIFFDFLDKENIEVTPTTKIYKNGKEVYKVEGKISQEKFLNEYNK